MSPFETELQSRLAAIRAQGLWRELRRVDSPQAARLELAGRSLLNFSSNDYLGLANHPALIEAAIHATDRFGAGAGASRLVCGSLAPHHQLEEALAAFKGTEAALAFSTGYACALGVIPALVGKDAVVILDKLVHASIVDAAKLSGAKLRVFRHNDLGDLEAKLTWARSSSWPGRVLVVTECVFSMDGDLAPLLNIVELKDRFGAWLMVDEAHATGLFGETRRGLVEEFGVSDRVEIQMGTLGKAIGASGGYIAGSRALVDLLINRARSFIFSTAPVPAAAAAAKAGIELIASAEGEQRRQRLWSLVELLKSALIGGQWRVPAVRSAIVPCIVGAETEAIALAESLRESGILVPAIRYPTVARSQARLRFAVSASHSAADIEQLRAAVVAHCSPRASS
jgi:8-amino-7-oxononanoate synthase